ncbi:SemiSWEET transporter [Hirschia baltica]|uniref:MtN3 and saliva related transmembrane protein n=1 Tax=Hirschia baltica (strain ATCC 49814 / DSM 5838 / IFAM 1418) TaxID=582402 RepID=C6XLT6_HIRBI|nr:SemiSWEET transporter [Hirschia baltica]ACT57992.1 conserved hypothetical protein [Hirschia baltica ATCC 49814]
MPISEIIGLIAASLTTGSFLPQAILALKTRNTDGISLAMYALFTLGVALWFVYGLMVISLPVIIANLITFLLAASILTMKVLNTKSGKKNESHTIDFDVQSVLPSAH